nr:G8 domain-containing protein DDB_G0286311-like [Paramormyrops kingsleyae]
MKSLAFLVLLIGVSTAFPAVNRHHSSRHSSGSDSDEMPGRFPFPPRRGPFSNLTPDQLLKLFLAAIFPPPATTHAPPSTTTSTTTPSTTPTTTPSTTPTTTPSTTPTTTPSTTPTTTPSTTLTTTPSTTPTTPTTTRKTT